MNLGKFKNIDKNGQNEILKRLKVLEFATILDNGEQIRIFRCQDVFESLNLDYYKMEIKQ